jgi:hypothetical protein
MHTKVILIFQFFENLPNRIHFDLDWVRIRFDFSCEIGIRFRICKKIKIAYFSINIYCEDLWRMGNLTQKFAQI